MASRDGSRFSRPSVVILVADGARPDTLAAAMDRGELPALSRLRAVGGLHQVTSVFPSVTGAAYTPLLLGRHPAAVGIPGIRWLDRARGATRWPSWSRSYMGWDLRTIDRDLDPLAPTLFELAPTRLGALSFIERGLAPGDKVVTGTRFLFRAGLTHFFGGLDQWIALDRRVTTAACDRIARQQPAFAFVVITAIDKASHTSGHDSPTARAALRIVDDTAARIRDDAERDGRWDQMHLWIVSDHGHSIVRNHEDLAGVIRATGTRVRAHPWTLGAGHRAAVMVSGNAMAHVYLDLELRARPFWPGLATRWEWLADALLERKSTDLLMMPVSASAMEIRSKARGRALVSTADGRYSYHCESGDPLGIGELGNLDDRDAYAATIASDYPDALVQLAHLCASARCGDLLISASRDWDLRARWEPVPHASSHGALHREHMMVPLLVNRPPAQAPRRTVDVFASAVAALGLSAVNSTEGSSWF